MPGETEKIAEKNPSTFWKLVKVWLSRVFLILFLIPFLMLSALPRRVKNGVASILKITGLLLFAGAGLYMIFLEVSYFFARWGFFGLLLGIFPPTAVILSTFFPIIFWVMEGTFPMLYFVIWGGGIVGAIISFVIAGLISSEE